LPFITPSFHQIASLCQCYAIAYCRVILVFGTLSCHQNHQVCKSHFRNLDYWAGWIGLHLTVRIIISFPNLRNYLIQAAPEHFILDQTTAIITATKGLKITVNPSALEKIDGSPIDGK
jgi:hypothetical protein